jgi:hypothetical protein
MMKYSVKEIRAQGLEAKWSKTRRGAPIIVARDPNAKLEHQRVQWWVVNDRMWKRAGEVGMMQAFSEHTVLGDFFGVPV